MHFLNGRTLARKDQIRWLDSVIRQLLAKLPGLLQQRMQGNMKRGFVMLLDRSLKVSVKVIQLVDRACWQPQLAFAHDPDDH
jgi:hypothetical protein